MQFCHEERDAKAFSNVGKVEDVLLLHLACRAVKGGEEIFCFLCRAIHYIKGDAS